MHFNSNFRKGTLFIAAFMILFAACKRASKDDNYLSDDDDRIGYAADISRIELANDDVISLADQAGTLYNATYIRKDNNSCATVATDTVSAIHTLIIRFGNTNCECADGRKRRGAIIISYTGKYSDTGKMHTITYDNYYVNDNHLTGTVKVTRVNTTVTGDWYYRVQVNDSLNMSPDPLQSKFVIWSGSLTRKWIGGSQDNHGDHRGIIAGFQQQAGRRRRSELVRSTRRVSRHPLQAIRVTIGVIALAHVLNLRAERYC